MAADAGSQRLHAHLNRLSGVWHLRHRDHGQDLASRPDPSLPAGTDRVPQIKHVVLLMMENHSFDNYLGMLGRGDGLPQPLPSNPAGDGTPVVAYEFASPGQVENVPSQSWRASHVQYAEGRNDGFVRAIEQLAPDADAALGMGHWTERDLPFYSALAHTFPLADRWFCSCLGPTFPNRRFLVAGTANGLIDDVMAGIIDYPRTGTIFDVLNRYSIRWLNYHHVTSRRLLHTRMAGRVGLRWARGLKLAAGQFLPTVKHLARGEIVATANLYPLGLWRTVSHLRHVRQFFADAAAGTLPPVSIVDPDFDTCSEENPQDVRVGEGYAAAVIDAVMRGPGWPHTLLIWFYDEHGGYYDHVPPPPAVEPDEMLPHSLRDRRGPLGWLAKHTGLRARVQQLDGAGHGRYDRLGFRVPAVVVSPYARPDFVSSTVYDHTSALKLIEEKFNLPPLTRRDAAATAPWEMLDLDAPPAFLDPPALSPPAVRWR